MSIQVWLEKDEKGRWNLQEILGDYTGEAFDGYHTFNELYEHRAELFIALCREIQKQKNTRFWRSETHSDGSWYDGWFILGIDSKKGSQISYHLPMSKWGETNFAVTLDKAPEWDGHTSDDVLERLKKL